MTRHIGVMLTVLLLLGLRSPVRAADAGDANAILDKAVAAIGGAEKLGKIQAASWKGKGTITFMGNDNEITTLVTVQGLDHSRRELEGNFDGNPFKGVTVLAGDKGWRIFGENKRALEGDALANEKRALYLSVVPMAILPLKGSSFKLEAIADETVNGKPAAGIKATGPDGKDFRLYFDKETGLPVKLVAKVAGFMGNEFTQDSTFSDYQEMGGVKIATKIVATRDGEKFQSVQISDFKVLDQVDPKTFAEPQ